MDHLSQIIDHFKLTAGVFYTGKLCGLSHFNENEALEGHIHLLRSGVLAVNGLDKSPLVLDQPSIIFLPRPTKHSLKAREIDNAELICANITYDSSSTSLLADALPDMLILPLESSPFLQTNIDWIISEAGDEQQGRQAVMNRLMEIFIINMLRSLLVKGELARGMLAGLMHPQLKQVLQQLHNAPQENWSLNKMAELALMSRSKFAEIFKTVIGQTPNDYLVSWRVATAQSLLKQGKSVSLVANNVGYDTASALARVFRKTCGMSPKQWLDSLSL
ncbi:AraC family transcriptional regulator [Thalassomonas actiniarum]|uniref:AraC family transcriptional regulator n=1 Tax=Thalassomonas actiniarum TaxID=485447 RepID=A0AAE9YZN3_9GAMM|nr:AraC family transcriptional regulator [Thalassomonas actiniarum]WDE02483.1 AraC family transcriptional regulator [Thalassomonas actiniarum]